MVGRAGQGSATASSSPRFTSSSGSSAAEDSQSSVTSISFTHSVSMMKQVLEK